MKITTDPRLFWFVKEGTTLDLDNTVQRDFFVEQVITHGTINDVKKLLTQITRENLRNSLERIGHFLPREIRSFWKTYLANY